MLFDRGQRLVMGHPRPLSLVVLSIICHVAWASFLFKESSWKLQDHFYINQAESVSYNVRDGEVEFRSQGTPITVYADVASDGIPVLHYINRSRRGLFIISSMKHLYGDLEEQQIRLTTGRIVVILYDANKLSLTEESSLRSQLFSFMKYRKMLKNKTYNLGPLRSSLSEILNIPAVVVIYESHKRPSNQTDPQKLAINDEETHYDLAGPKDISQISMAEDQSVTLEGNITECSTNISQSFALKQIEDRILVLSDSSGHEIKFTQELIFERQIILRIDNPLQRGLLVATGMTSFYYRLPNMRFPLSLESIVAFVFDSSKMDEVQEEDLRNRAIQSIRLFHVMHEGIHPWYDLQHVLIDLLKSSSTLGSVVVFEKNSSLQFTPPLNFHHHSPPEIPANDLRADDVINAEVESDVTEENCNILIRDEDGNIFEFLQRIGPENDVVLLAINDSRRGLLIISRSSQAKFRSRVVRRSLKEESVIAVVYGTAGLSDEQEKILRAELIELIRALNQFDDLDADWSHTADDAINLCASNNINSVSIAIFENNTTSTPKPPIVYQMAAIQEPSRDSTDESQMNGPRNSVCTINETAPADLNPNLTDETDTKSTDMTGISSNSVETRNCDVLCVEDDWYFGSDWNFL